MATRFISCLILFLLCAILKTSFCTSDVLQLFPDFKEVQKSVNELQKSVSELQSSVNAMKGILVDQSLMKISFDSHLSGNRVYTGNTDVVIAFDIIQTNRGNAYQNDGTFVVPVGGTYLFSWTIYGQSGSSISTGLFVNGQRTELLHTDGSSKAILRPVATKVAILDLNPNDHVMVKTIGYNVRGQIFSDKYGHSSFAGTLLFLN